MNNTPQIGEIYFHYKHNPTKDQTNYKYEIIGKAIHTETDEVIVIYKPLYNSEHIAENQVNFYARPISMFFDHIEKPDYQGPRFYSSIK
jgi:hypothetical protein